MVTSGAEAGRHLRPSILSGSYPDDGRGAAGLNVPPLLNVRPSKPIPTGDKGSRWATGGPRG